MAGQQEVLEVVRRAFRHFRELAFHFLGCLARDDGQSAAVAAALERERLSVDFLARIQFGGLSALVSRRNVGCLSVSAITFRKRRQIVQAVIPCYVHRRHFASLGEPEQDR